MIGFLRSLNLHTVFLWCSGKWTPRNKYLLELNKSRSKVQENIISCERILRFAMFWPMKNISQNYKPIRVRLWLVYNFTENNCCLRLFTGFIQTQEKHPTSPDKISILTWKLLFISSQIFLVNKILKNSLLAKHLISIDVALIKKS